MLTDDFKSLAVEGKLQTRFVSIVLDANDTRGIPLGQGKCVGVILKANHFLPNSLVAQITNVPAYFYYGDPNQQTYEYHLNVGAAAIPNTSPSELILCSDLDQVWLRLPTIFNEQTIIVEAIIFEKVESCSCEQ